MKIAILNGPNLNLLGKREPEVYGSLTLDEIEKRTQKKVESLLKEKEKLECEWFQTNSEQELIEKIHQVFLDQENFKGIIINPGAFTHSSVAIYDALKMVKTPVVEVHLSNTYKREEIRKNKVTTPASTILIEGAGPSVYLQGILSLIYQI